MMDKDLKKLVKALRAAGYSVEETRRGHIRVSKDGRLLTTFSGTGSPRSSAMASSGRPAADEPGRSEADVVPPTSPGPLHHLTPLGQELSMEYNATLTIRVKGDDVDDALVEALRDYHPAVSPSLLAEDAWDVVITFSAETLGQALTTARAIGEHLGGMIGLEVVPTTAWDRRADQDVRSDDDLVGVTEASSRLGVTPQAVRERLSTGTLPGRKIGREWVIPARSLAR